MSPDDFAFTLTIPADARFVAVARDLTLQAATYAQLPKADGAALADRVAASAERSVGAGADCTLTFERANGSLTVAVDGETIRHP